MLMFHIYKIWCLSAVSWMKSSRFWDTKLSQWSNLISVTLIMTQCCQQVGAADSVSASPAALQNLLCSPDWDTSTPLNFQMNQPPVTFMQWHSSVQTDHPSPSSLAATTNKLFDLRGICDCVAFRELSKPHSYSAVMAHICTHRLHWATHGETCPTCDIECHKCQKLSTLSLFTAVNVELDIKAIVRVIHMLPSLCSRNDCRSHSGMCECQRQMGCWLMPTFLHELGKLTAPFFGLYKYMKCFPAKLKGFWGKNNSTIWLLLQQIWLHTLVRIIVYSEIFQNIFCIFD